MNSWMHHRVFQEIIRGILPELTNESNQLRCGIHVWVAFFSSLMPFTSSLEWNHHTFGPCLTCFCTPPPPSTELQGGLCCIGSSCCLWCMELKERKLLAIFVIIILSHVPCVTDICCPVLDWKKKLFQFLLTVLHSTHTSYTSGFDHESSQG